ncbi:MAG TPA: 2-oxoglutarate dehydrogenase E1 component [Myxococcales bacterium]|nr:2-oxoglutarate dehydrogenase E1 component [Myxococcales bacterium]HAN30725.1 2-oxoglutarate dehydrogenase E1 component [Myxococcales bacterium]
MSQPTPKGVEIDITDLSAANLAFVEALYSQWLVEPTSVDTNWQALFEKEAGEATQLGPSFTPRSLFNPAGGGDGAPRRVLPTTISDPELVAKRVPLLRELVLFHDLPQAAIALVAEVCSEVVMQANETLFRTGDLGDGLYIIINGSMRVERGGRVIASLGRGEVVGELAIMDQLPRSADAIADTSCSLLKLASGVLDELLDRHGALARNLFRVVTKRLRKTNARQERVDHLIRAYRVRGHTIAELDPLGRGRKTHPELELSFHGLSEDVLDLPFSSRTLHDAKVMTLRRIIQRLHNTYCQHIGVQFMHIDDLHVQRWLQARMEDNENRQQLSRDAQIRILTRLIEAELFETFIHKKFLGAKRFSLEGGESLLPLLDMAIEEASKYGIDHICIGMAHRGRLNVLANIMGKNPEQIFEEFEDAHASEYIGRGDVKYHLGFNSIYQTSTGEDVHLSMSFNPSHLEFVTPVVQGRVRGKQDRLGDVERGRVLPLVVHGDSAFAGQGVVQEALNMSQLPGYAVGGTVHVIINNQVGFTTPPESYRSGPYATDIAKMLEIPIFHVNGEHPDAVAQAIEVAMEFRERFKRDVVIDMYCFRRHGHNEGDEPRFTQPLMYRWVDQQPTVRASYTRNVLELGAVTNAEVKKLEDACYQRLEEGLSRARDASSGYTNPLALDHRGNWDNYHGSYERFAGFVDTAVAKEELSSLIRAFSTPPDGFTLNSKLRRLMKQRLEMAEGSRVLDWGTGEALAFATLVQQGYPIRVSGQDSARGTFSHRHAVWHDQKDGSLYVPLDRIDANQARFQVWDSPLSENGVLGFDYGYSLEWPDALTIWEAQFGDFANGAQVIIDQFISSCEDKWERLSGLVMMLPHGFEGQGPEHSSARLERFLTLAAEDNLQVCNLTTPAQLFHCLRKQMLSKVRKPLILMTPKSLLRHPKAVSSLQDLSEGHFQPVIGDPLVDMSTCKRVLLCTGKIYYELLQARQEKDAMDHAIVRLEQLYPMCEDALEQALSDLPEGSEVRWVQEEPVNMGAWVFLRFRLGWRVFGKYPFRFVTRPESASPATGSKASHIIEQKQIIAAAFEELPIHCKN